MNDWDESERACDWSAEHFVAGKTYKVEWRTAYGRRFTFLDRVEPGQFTLGGFAGRREPVKIAYADIVTAQEWVPGLKGIREREARR